MVTAVKKANKGAVTALLDSIGMDKVEEMILDDMSYAAISAALKVNKRTFENWIDADVVRSARARDARVKSSKQCDELALQALEAIDDDAPAGMIARQREIASHYRWRAKVRNPKEYGDKVQVDAEVKVETVDQVDAMLTLLVAKMAPK